MGVHIFYVVSGGVLLVILLAPVVFYCKNRGKKSDILHKELEDGMPHIFNVPDDRQ